MTLDEARERIGARVCYQGCGPMDEDFGQITSVNDHYVFVQYEGETHTKATNPHDLDFVAERPR